MNHTVTPMHCGTFSLDMDTLALGVDPGTEVAAPSISYLVEGPTTVEPLLVDTSFGDVDHERDDGGFLVRDESGKRLAVWLVDGTEAVDPASRSAGWSSPP